MDLDLERRMCMDLMRGGMDVCGEGNALFSLFAGVNKEKEWKSPFLNQSQNLLQNSGSSRLTEPGCQLTELQFSDPW